MHRSHLPLKVWFTAAWLVATHRNGMSARQLWLQLGLGSYKSARLLLRKLRAAMVDPDRSPLDGLVEVDETSLPFRTKDDPVGPRPGRPHDGKLLIAGAVEIRGAGPGRTRLAVIGDYSAASLGGFVAGNAGGARPAPGRAAQGRPGQPAPGGGARRRAAHGADRGRDGRCVPVR